MKSTIEMRFDDSSFGILDKWAIICIFEYMSVRDVLVMKLCSKRMHTITVKYLSDTYYKTNYLDHQEKLLESQIQRNKTLIYELEANIKQVHKYRSMHNNIRPDGYLGTHKIYDKSMISWKYCNVEYAIRKWGDMYSLCNVVYIKTGQSQKVYNKIQKKMEKEKWKRVFIPHKIKRENIERMYTSVSDKYYTKFYPCKKCKGDHCLQDCPKTKCNICKAVGHLTRRCPKAKCKICKLIGQHITSRCPAIRCNNCNKQGHVAKRCRKNKKR